MGRRKRVGPTGVGDGSGSARGYYQSIEELKRHHTRIFSGRTHVAVIERPFSGENFGVGHVTVRIDHRHADKRGQLRTAVAAIFQRYPNTSFSFSVTADVVTRGPRGNSFGVFYGQDYADRDLNLFGPYEVDDVRDSDDLPTDFEVQDFANVFERAFVDSSATVVDVIAAVYIGTYKIDNFARNKKCGQRLCEIAVAGL